MSDNIACLLYTLGPGIIAALCYGLIFILCVLGFSINIASAIVSICAVCLSIFYQRKNQKSNEKLKNIVLKTNDRIMESLYPDRRISKYEEYFGKFVGQNKMRVRLQIFIIDIVEWTMSKERYGVTNLMRGHHCILARVFDKYMIYVISKNDRSKCFIEWFLEDTKVSLGGYNINPSGEVTFPDKICWFNPIYNWGLDEISSSSNYRTENLHFNLYFKDKEECNKLSNCANECFDEVEFAQYRKHSEKHA